MSGLTGSQEHWANDYAGGASAPQDIGRYLEYNRVLGLNNMNKTYGSGANLQEAQKDMFSKYSEAIKKGTNNLGQLNDYLGYAKAFGFQTATPDEGVLKQLSIEALNGNAGAKSYLDAMKLTPQSGTALWNGADPKSLEVNSASYNKYLSDNPTSDMARTNDTNYWNHFNDIIKNGGSMTQDEQNSYNSVASKWGLADMHDPYVQQQATLKDDKQNALNAQDVALNQGMSQMDANSFQQMQQLHQQMNSRGVSDSGIAADAYMRAQMANNQNYQKAFSDSATTKSDLQTKYDDAISGSKINAQTYYNKQAADQAANQTKLAEIQSNQDKWMTEQTGSLWLKGQQITQNGKPVTTVEWNKMTETQRHNLTQEALDGTKISNDYNIGLGTLQNNANKNANDYNLGMTNANISATKVANDLQIALANNQISRDKLTFDYTQLDANNKIAQDKLGVAIQNAQSTADKNQLTAWGQQADRVWNGILANQKKANRTADDDKALQSLIDQYNSVNNQISNKVGGMSFQSSSEGGGGNSSTDKWATTGSYGNYYKYGKQPTTFNSQMNSAIQGKNGIAVPFADAKGLTELIGRESSWSSTAKNPSSSAYGYGQFLTATRNSYEKATGLSYNDPVNQILMTYKYVKDRYGSVQAALNFWDKNKWY